MIVDKTSPFFSKLFLELIQTNAKFKTDIQAAMPAIFADVESFSINPNCSCRGRIEARISSNRDSSYTFLMDWLQQNPQPNFNPQAIIQKFATTTLGGTIVTLPNTEQAFAEFYTKAISERYVFRGFSIVPAGDNIKVYFL
jgi:hypothetical protein